MDVTYIDFYTCNNGDDLSRWEEDQLIIFWLYCGVKINHCWNKKGKIEFCCIPQFTSHGFNIALIRVFSWCYQIKLLNNTFHSF